MAVAQRLNQPLVELFIQTINSTLSYQQKHFQELCSCMTVNLSTRLRRGTKARPPIDNGIRILIKYLRQYVHSHWSIGVFR